MDKRKILVNKIRCKRCNDIIESTHVHEFNTCKCGACSVDGGREYIRRVGAPSLMEDLNVYSTDVKQLSIGQKIKINKIQCQLCREIIESKYINDFKMCKCGKCGVDGGHEYIKRIGDSLLYIELSEFD
jgi:hypothetical protein